MQLILYDFVYEWNLYSEILFHRVTLSFKIMCVNYFKHKWLKSRNCSFYAAPSSKLHLQSNNKFTNCW